MKTFTDWMEEGRVEMAPGWFKTNTKRLLFSDGSSMSIQASQNHYCSPRCNIENYDQYDSFEIGFPSKYYDQIEKYKGGNGDQTDSVFGWVPKSVVEQIVEGSGGCCWLG